jgi:hypothetical protein
MMVGGVAGAASLAFGMLSASAAGPRISLDPTQGTPASVVKAQGTGFCGSSSCSTAQIVFQGVIVADGIAVSADGSFQASFQPAAGPPGWKTVLGQQKDASGTWIVSSPASFYLTLAPPTPTPTSFPRTPTPARSPSPRPSAPPAATGSPPAATGTPSASTTPPVGGGPAGSSQGSTPAGGVQWWPWVAVIAALLLGAIVFIVPRFWRPGWRVNEERPPRP